MKGNNFEVIDKRMASSEIKSLSDPPLNASLIANVSPPSALPSFITSPVLGSPSVSSTSFPQPVISPVKASESSPYPLAMKSTTPTPNALVTDQSLLPANSHPTQSSHATPVNGSPKEGPPLTDSQATAPPLMPNEDESGDNWMRWIRGTVHSVGQKVAGKAKSSMDSLITTLDPQMKDLINSGGDIDIMVASDKEVKISPVKEAFQKTFGKATISGLASEASGTAAQPVGFDSAMKSAEERINTLRQSPGKVHPQQPIVAVEAFLVELTPQYWVEMSILLLDDPWHDLILQTYTQPIPIPELMIQELQSSTPDNYPLKDSGFSKTIGQVASTQLNVHHTMWHETMTGISRREFLVTAAKVLAELYQSQLPQDLI